ncbi:MAG: EAL domain-containing protein [Lachnospiraceae bacterium]|nr:EAL domain-containing protein [Lachnospiraceae bacterium]
MTKPIFAALSIVVLVISILAMYFAHERKEKIANVTVKLLGATVVAIFLTAMEMVTNDANIMIVARSMFYISMDWLCFLFMKFCVEYAGLQVKLKVFDRIMTVVLMIDSVLMAVNHFTEFAAEFIVFSVDEENFVGADFFAYYYVHLVLCYLPLLIGIILLLIETIKAPDMYKRKYWNILVACVVAVVADAIFLAVGWYIDISVYVIGLSDFAVIYFVFSYVPKSLKRDIQGRILDNMQDLVIIFDNEDICVYANGRLKEKGIDTIMTLEEVKDILRDGFNEQKLFMFAEDGKNRLYNPDFRELKDSKGRYMGCFYVLHDVTEEKEMQREQYILANFDQLTGIYNRNKFNEAATEFMEAAPNEKYLIICSDIRHFKTLNDMFGQRIGDEVLKLIAQGLRTNDTGNYVYGRIGSDNFAMCIAEKDFRMDFFLVETKKYVSLNYLQYSIVNHIGFYRVEDIHMSVTTMCDRAMMAINNIRGDYHQKIAFYDDRLRDRYVREQEIIRAFEAAFDDESFVVFLQPQYNTATHRVSSAEALVRWKNGKGGYVSPAEFVPVLEARGLITRLDIYVWNLVAGLLRKWKSEGRNDIAVSVNISPKDFFYADLYEIFSGIVDGYGISPKNLRLEITESAFVVDFDKQMETIEKLRKKGFLIEMDDFGKGYSSLNSLKDIPVDIIKLDMAFMSDSDKYGRGRDIVDMVVQMAKRLKMPVIAEGVENEEQLKFLSEVGCHLIQGYYYSRPIPIEEFESKYRDFY